MDKRFIIIHPSDIIRKGLWAILRESFHFEFIMLKAVNETADYSGFVNTELFVFIDENLSNTANQTLINRAFSKAYKVHFVVIANNANSVQWNTIKINDSAFNILNTVRGLVHKKDDLLPCISELTEREKDVLGLVALGHANKEIADKLFISSHTVISHRKHITDKLGIKSISGLTVYAILNKLIDTENIDPTTLI